MKFNEQSSRAYWANVVWTKERQWWMETADGCKGSVVQEVNYVCLVVPGLHKTVRLHQFNQFIHESTWMFVSDEMMVYRAVQIANLPSLTLKRQISDWRASASHRGFMSRWTVEKLQSCHLYHQNLSNAVPVVASMTAGYMTVCILTQVVTAIFNYQLARCAVVQCVVKPPWCLVTPSLLGPMRK